MNSIKVLMPRLKACMRGIFTHLPVLLAGLLIAGTVTVNGAVTFNQSVITAESDVLNTGTLISANNLGSSPAIATVNGISFGTSQSGLTGWANGGGDFSTSFTGGLDTLMSGLVYVTPATSGTLVVSGFTSGQTYRVQLLIQNAANTSGDNTSVTIQGVTHNVGTLGSSAYNVRAEFTATGTSETITFADASGSDPVLNAYVVHGLPEVDVQGNGVSIVSGDTTPLTADHTDFGSTASGGGTVTRTFTIENTGAAALNLTASPTVQISGAGAAHFTVTAADFGLGTITVANSGFELPAYGAGGFSYLTGLNSSWTYGGNSGVAHNGSPWYVNPAPGGMQAAFIQSNGAGAYIQQAFNFPAAGSYDVSFWIVRRAAGYPGNDIDVRMDGVSIGSVLSAAQADDTWAQVTFTYNCPSAGSHTLSFVGQHASDYDSAIDDVAISLGSAQIAAGTSAAFQIEYAPSAVGVHTATVTIANDDSDEGSYTFDITGTGIAAGAQGWTADTGNGNGSGNSTADGLRVRLNGANIEFSADGGTSWTATVSYASTTALTLTGSGDDDTFVIDFSGGNPIPSGGITVVGGSQVTGDKLQVTGGAFGTVTHNLLTANDGNLVVAGMGTINYTGLEPVDMTGSTITDLIFNLPAGPSNAILEDDGTAANGVSRFRSNPVTFESTDFTNPSGSVTINRGNASDTLTINAVPDFTATLTVGGVATEFNTVTIAGAMSLASGKNLSINTASTVSFSAASSDVALLGTGVASITTLRDITFASGSSLTTVNGNLTLSANQQGSPTSGAFVGVDINGGTVQSTGSGSVTVSGKGGDVGTSGVDARRYGVELRNSAHIYGGTSGTCLVQGTGGTNPGWRNYGVHMLDAGSSITSTGANVQVVGLGGGTGAGSNEDVGIWLDAGLISAGGTGTVLVQGTGATAAVLDNNHHGVHLVAAAINSTGGAVTVTGVAGGGAGGGNNIGLVLLAGSTISAGGATSAVTVTGTGGAGNGGYGVALLGNGASITSSGGDVLVTGTASQIAAASIRGIWMVTGTPSITTALNGGNLTLVADSMDIVNGTISANAASVVTLRPKTAGTVVNLGGADVIGTPNTLGLTSAELAAVSAGTVIIGHTSSAALTVSSAITHADASALSIVAGTGLDINLNASVTTAGGAVTFNNAVVLGVAAAVDTTNGGSIPAGAAIGFNSTINLNNLRLTLNGGNANYSITTAISGGTGGLTKQGGGILTLSGGNSFIGNVTVSAGTIKIGSITALGNADTQFTKVTVASGATVDFNGQVDARYGYTIAGTGVSGNGALVNNGAAIGNGFLQCSNIRLAADASMGGTGNWALLTAGYGATTLDLAGFTLTKTGANTIYLCNSTLTAGTVQVSAGVLATVQAASDGSAAAFVVDNTAAVELSLEVNLSVGSLAGGGATGGNVVLGANTLTAGALNTSTSFGGVISGLSGSLVKNGTGTLTLTGANTYTGTTTINGGKFLVDGSLSASSAVTVATGGTLGGSGTVGVVVVQSGGTLAPGASPGILNVGNLTLNSGSTLNIELDGTTAGTGYDQLNVTGTVSLGGATVVFSGTHGFLPGDSFSFILNDLADAVTGTFSGLAEGAQISDFLGSGTIATISYIGGTGNDVTLTISGTPAVWSADTANGNGSDNAASDSLRIRRNGSEIEFSADDGATWPTFVVYDKTSVLTLQGSGDDDKFVVDYSGGNPIPYGGVVLVGAGQVTTGDYLEMMSGSHTTVTYAFLNNNDGSVDVDGNLISYTGLEPIIDNSDAVNRVFDFTGGAETITVKSVSATQTFVDSTLGESVTFNNPTATMTINAGTGDDIINLGSLSSGWVAAVNLNGGAGDDTFYLNKTVSTSAAITLNGDAHTTGDTLNFDREGDTAITSSGASPGTVSGGSPAIQTVNYDTVETINMYLYGSPGDYVIADRGPYFSTGTILLYKAASGMQQVVDTTIKDPYEISLDAAGNFVIADYEVNAGTAGIYLIDRLTGTKSTVSSDGAFEVPFGVKADTSGGVNDGKYIVADLDADNNGTSAWGALFVVDPGSASPGNQTLLSSRTAGTGTFFYWLTGLALGGSGDIYVCDQGNLSSPGTQPPRVFHVDPTTGNRTVMAQGGTMVRPVGVTVISGTGNTAQLLVVDAGSKKLLRFTGTGSPITISGTEELTHSGVTFDSPTHVAIDGSGNYVISDAPPYATAGHRRIHIMDSGTLVTTTVTADGFLEQPRGVQVLP